MRLSALLYIICIIAVYGYTSFYTLKSVDIFPYIHLNCYNASSKKGSDSKGVCMATTKARKTMIGIDLDVDGWIEWAGKFRSGSQAEYLNQLARKDRDRAIADDETAKKYLAYLTATGRNAEMESLDRRNERKARREE